MAPRLSTRQKQKIEAGGPPPREPGMGDNRSAEEKKADREEDERVALISYVSRLTQAEGAIEVARAPLKAAQEARSKIIGLAKGAGFSAKELQARMAEMSTPTRKMVEIAQREARHRRWLGITDADQSDLLTGDRAPDSAKDEAHWKGEGYKAGLRMMEAKPPKECPTLHLQAWMAEHSRGFGEATAANAPKAPPKPVAQKAAEDFAADNPEVDIKKAAAKLKSDPKFMDRSAPPEDEMAAGVIHEPGTGSAGPDDAFEATPEELAAQTPRQAVTAGRDEDEPVV